MPLRPAPALEAEFQGLEALLFDVADLRVELTDRTAGAFIEKRIAEYRRAYALKTLKDEPRLRAYRDFFWRVGVDPTKVRPVAEALLRRVIQGKPFRGSTPSWTRITSRPPRLGSRWLRSIARGGMGACG